MIVILECYRAVYPRQIRVCRWDAGEFSWDQSFFEVFMRVNFISVGKHAFNSHFLNVFNNIIHQKTFSFDVMKMGVVEQTDAKLSIQIAKRLKLHWSQTHTDHRVIHELMSRSEISVSEHHKRFFFQM